MHLLHSLLLVQAQSGVWWGQYLDFASISQSFAIQYDKDAFFMHINEWTAHINEAAMLHCFHKVRTAVTNKLLLIEVFRKIDIMIGTDG